MDGVYLVVANDDAISEKRLTGSIGPTISWVTFLGLNPRVSAADLLPLGSLLPVVEREFVDQLRLTQWEKLA
jgi:hypothetical protein